MSHILGLLGKDAAIATGPKTLGDMAAALPVRGADPLRVWLSPGHEAALGIKSLRTRDLTVDGEEPHFSRAHRITIVLDGYIANAKALRRELEDKGIRLHGHGDAELLAESTALFGLNRLLQKLEGSFSFALWDGATGSLHLVRDPTGLRPLFCTRVGNLTAFATNPGAFTKIPGFTAKINKPAVAEYLAYGYTTGPHTVMDGVISIPPGHRMMLHENDKSLPAPEAWWSPARTLEENALRNNISPLEKTLKTVIEEAAATDLPLNLLALGSNARRLEKHLDGLQFKSIELSEPDPITVQAACDACLLLPAPASNPLALVLAHTLAQHTQQNSALLIGGEVTPITKDEKPSNATKWPKSLQRLAAKALPARFANLGLDAESRFENENRLWKNLFEVNNATAHIYPHMDMQDGFKSAYLNYIGPMTARDAVMLDGLAAQNAQDLRLPLADPRLMEHWLAASIKTSVPELGNWIRGPLRVRLQKTLNKQVYDACGITNPKPIEDAAQKFFAGDNTDARKLYAWLMLGQWLFANRLL